ncbi:MAG: HdeD family acid-resistance protein [Eubacteriaceae bacterium]
MDYRETEELKVDLLEQSFGKWWIMLLEGFCLLILTGIMLINKSTTFELLILLIGIYRGIMGVIYIASEIISKAKYGENYGISLLRGIVDLVIAGICLFLPNLIINFFVIIIGIWAIVAGIFFLFTGLRSEGSGKFLKMLLGLVLMAFGLFAFFQPKEIADFLTFLIGLVLGVFGIFLIYQSFSMKKHFEAIKEAKKGYKDYEIK